jgi:hypothetical protein
MNKPNAGAKPHVHAEVIKAWADGAEIEYFSKSSEKWFAVVNNDPFWSLNEKYRVKPKVTHKIGNIYKFYDGTDQMLVCSSSFQVVMVSISGSLRGCRADDSAKVEDIWKITEEEFKDIVGGNPSDYTLIESND